ncbi:hypothetical protein [Pleurocapsa sp. FMAR1]|uniref:hypothetical protein n=1 Tax=Pleurocapsa sp. FMAR1 TaxID=3040204 RepID=UPI0029C6E452|nr:hypothetical protein [Pleurocapsa sp. FMAR1]
MIYSKSNTKLSNIAENKVVYDDNKVRLWFQKFWQFSLFYGDYLGSLHSNKKRVG